MKAKQLILKHWIKLVLLCLLTMLMVAGTRLIKADKKMLTTLNYIILKPRQNITLNIFEAEKYESALIVQQLVGNLIYYSNKGRYESRLAEKWEIESDTKWIFTLKKNLKCENGEEITPKSFKQSLDRSLFIYSKMGGVPILENLLGYQDFLRANFNNENIFNISPLAGIRYTDTEIIFEFNKKIRSGLLQILSFTPFGYICSKNFNNNGSWKNDKSFISSGPYVVDEINIGTSYNLIKNKYWMDFASSAPDRVIFTHDQGLVNANQPTIVDAFTNEYSNSQLTKYKLVPEYINSILLGNYEGHGYFSNLHNRKYFRHLVNMASNEMLPVEFGTNMRSNSFYPNQEIHRVEENEIIRGDIPKTELVIEGDIPSEGTSRWYSWLVLKSAMEKNKIKYRFAKNESSFSEISSRKYDIRIRGSSIGGGVEAWGLYVSFCSAMGINFPDPSGRVCKLIEDYESHKYDDQELTQNFFQYIKEDSAILPISHYGVSLYLSRHIDTSSISLLMSIMRFDQILLEP